MAMQYAMLLMRDARGLGCKCDCGWMQTLNGYIRTDHGSVQITNDVELNRLCCKTPCGTLLHEIA